MKRFLTLALVMFALSAQSPAPSPAAKPHREMVYQFGYNTKAADQGNGTGTTTIDILGTAPDGGVMISGTDYWWNTARPRATNTCEVYASGAVKCADRPYAISPIQVTLFPLFGKSYFKGLNADGTSSWTQTYTVYAAIVPGTSNPFTGNAYTWDCVYKLQGKGLSATDKRVVAIDLTGTLTQEGGRYKSGTTKAQIAFDTKSKIPIIVQEVRSRLPQASVYNRDFVQVKLLKDSGWKG